VVSLPARPRLHLGGEAIAGEIRRNSHVVPRRHLTVCGITVAKVKAPGNLAKRASTSCRGTTRRSCSHASFRASERPEESFDSPGLNVSTGYCAGVARKTAVRGSNESGSANSAMNAN
jgi:hypothetical protein